MFFFGKHRAQNRRKSTLLIRAPAKVAQYPAALFFLEQPSLRRGKVGRRIEAGAQLGLFE